MNAARASSTDPYGLLLTLDGYGAPQERCNDHRLLKRVLTELPFEIGMRILDGPYTVEVDEPGIAGLSGFIFIIESHISIHTYAERGFVTVDVYSCKPFDADVAIRFIGSSFELSSWETELVKRGRRFNASPPFRPQSWP